MKKSKIISAFNYTVYLFFAFTLLCFYNYYHHISLILLLIGYFIFLFYKDKKLFFVIILFSIFIHVKLQYDFNQLNNNSPQTNTCIITSIPDYNENQVKFYCQSKKIKLIVYSDDIKTKLNIGYTIKINPNFKRIKQNTIPYQFNYASYLLSKKIVYRSMNEKVTIVNKESSLRFLVINLIINYYEDSKLKEYILSFVVGNKNELDNEFYQNMQSINISHLFVISGFHVGFLYYSFKLIFKHLRVTDETSDIIIVIILIVFLIINNFSLSLLRAVSFIFLYLLKKRFQIDIDNINILSLIGVVNIIINPYILYDPGFILSYFITFFLLLSRKIIKYNKRYIINLYKINLIATIFSLPIIANFSFNYNFLSWFLTPVFVIYYTFVIFPLTLILICFPFLDSLFYPLFNFYQQIVSVVTKIEFLKINTGAFTVNRNIFYYICLYIIMIKIELKKKPMILIMLLFINILFYHKLTLTEEVTFFDVSQGDSIFIRSNINKCKALIDISGSEYDFHPGIRVLNYFQATQVTELDYFFITHTDYDHAGDYKYILDNIKVNNLVLSMYDESSLHDEIIEYATKKKINIIIIRAYITLECGDISFHIINPRENNNTNNDNSLVLFLSFHEDRYLFLGDISKKIEEQIVSTYSINADFIKIAHHGSKNSTSEEFINSINCQYGIISVGKNNYHHPSIEVLSLLDKYKIVYYRTDNDGTISVKYYLGILRMIRAHKPYNINVFVCLSLNTCV